MRFIVEYESLEKAEKLQPKVEDISDAPEFTIHCEMFPYSSIIVDRSEASDRLKQLEDLPGVRQVWLDDVVIPCIATVDSATLEWGLRTYKEIHEEAFIEGWDDEQLKEALSKVLPSGLWMYNFNYMGKTAPALLPMGPIKSIEDIVKYVEADKCPNRGEDSIVVILDTGVAEDAVHSKYRYKGYVPLGEKIERFRKYNPKVGCIKVKNDPWADERGHGTMVTSIAHGIDSYKIEGIAHEAKIVSVKIIGFLSELLNAFEYIIRLAEEEDKHIVVNMSLGIRDFHAPISVTHPFVVAYTALCLHPNVTVVNAAGNEGYFQQPTPYGAEMNTIGTMGSIPYNICVGATGEDGFVENIHNYSSRGGGRWGGKPDVVAPTHGFVGWSGRNKNPKKAQVIWIGNWGGTSAATPVVTGVAAIVASDLYDRGLLEKLGVMTSEVIKRKIITAADQLPFWNLPGTWSPRHGAGVVKALGAVHLPPLGAIDNQHLITAGIVAGAAGLTALIAKVLNII